MCSKIRIGQFNCKLGDTYNLIFQLQKIKLKRYTFKTSTFSINVSKRKLSNKNVLSLLVVD